MFSFVGSEDIKVGGSILLTCRGFRRILVGIASNLF
jgi:hypothetical protein